MVDRLNPNGIVSGRLIASSPVGQSVRTLSLVLVKNGIRTAVGDQSIAVTANASGNPRIDMVQWDGKSLTVKAGTAAAAPVCPTPDSGNVPIALLYLPTGYTEVYGIGAGGGGGGHIFAYYYAYSGLFAHRVGVTQDDVSSASYVDVDDMYLSCYFPKSGLGYEFEFAALVANVSATDVEGALTIGCNGDLSGGPTETWVNMVAKTTYNVYRKDVCTYSVPDVTAAGVHYAVKGRAKKSAGTNVISILGRSITIRQRN